MLRCLYAQCTIEDEETMSESLMQTAFQEELQAMFCKRSNKTYSVNEIDVNDNIKGTSITVSDPRTWEETGKHKQVKKGAQRTCS